MVTNEGDRVSDERIDQIWLDLEWMGKDPSLAAGAGCRHIRYLLRESRDARQAAATAAALRVELRDARAEVANLRNSQQIAAPSPRHYRELVAERDDLRAENERLNERVKNLLREQVAGIEYMKEADVLRAKLAAAERELAVSEREVVRVRGYFTAATEAERVAVVERDAAERQLAAVRALADKFERWPSGPSYAVTARAIREALSSEGGTE